MEKDICYGQSDIPLAETFESEVVQIIKNNPVLKEDLMVYSSPLKRCKMLSNKLFNQEVIFDDRLMELNFGDWELKAWNDINQIELNHWMNDFVNIRCPNGESYLDLNQRVISFIESIEHTFCKKIVIVTHAGVIRSFLANHNKIDLKDSFNLKVGYGELILIPH